MTRKSELIETAYINAKAIVRGNRAMVFKDKGTHTKKFKAKVARHAGKLAKQNPYSPEDAAEQEFEA